MSPPEDQGIDRKADLTGQIANSKLDKLPLGWAAASLWWFGFVGVFLENSIVCQKSMPKFFIF